ncbi:MAG: RNA-binding S4 domain-containing protein [Alphaproteobacteria bacterium]
MIDSAGQVQSNHSMRLDKWLWYARFSKSRTTATLLCTDGRVRINRRRISKAHAPVRIGDVLTFPQAKKIRVVRVLSLGRRRGPATEAATLYEDLAPPEPQKSSELEKTISGRRLPGSGRPTKSDRRAVDLLKARYNV